VTQAVTLLEGVPGTAVVGDRAYDADALIAHVGFHGMQAVIPSRGNRRSPRAHDAEKYRRRNVIERFFGRMKQFRRVATRYDKTATSYLGFFATAAMLVTLSGWR
jgi:transposase